MSRQTHQSSLIPFHLTIPSHHVHLLSSCIISHIAHFNSSATWQTQPDNYTLMSHIKHHLLHLLSCPITPLMPILSPLPHHWQHLSPLPPIPNCSLPPNPPAHCSQSRLANQLRAGRARAAAEHRVSSRGREGIGHLKISGGCHCSRGFLEMCCILIKSLPFYALVIDKQISFLILFIFSLKCKLVREECVRCPWALQAFFLSLLWRFAYVKLAQPQSGNSNSCEIWSFTEVLFTSILNQNWQILG